MVKNGALAINVGKIVWAGKRIALPADIESVANQVYDGEGGWVTPTFLGAHALPPEYEGQGDEYIDFVCNTVMSELAAQHLVRQGKLIKSIGR